MATQVLPNLPNEIICKIIALLGEETLYYLGDFLQAGKRGYALVHEPSVLKMCDITPMVHYVTSQICKGGQFRPVFPQRQGSKRSVSVVRSPSRRPPVGSRFSYGRVVQWLLSTFHALWLNTYDEAFKFPDDDVIMHPKCLHGENCRNFYLGVDGSCENCKLYWICVNVFQML
ncbi:hypothetical protein F2Q70_00020744 [Brassica cretica]|uniref:F-box domain-containing protein n=1 Tax=Brassica cretica TaxID=69181 RepID=A0A8S9GM30_BRACR|nr:hypothetical protein F2Q70_00020744 [Brassica cretica]